MFSNAFILFLAMLVDRRIGDPDWLWRRYTHPVVWFGKAIERLEAWLWNGQLPEEKQKQRGVLLIGLLVGGTWLIGQFIGGVLDIFGPIGAVVEIAIVAVFLAQKSLADHALAVVQGFETSGLKGGRQAVAMIVGRDPKTLNEAGVARATIESVAENSSDGIVAPALFYLAFGLPGILVYKAINTADSMIGHKTERYLHFGWAAARLDDWSNWVPARATALLTIIAAVTTHGLGAANRGWAVALRDHGLHRSTNAGWPEASFAGVLNLRLGGPRHYKGDIAREAYLNAGGRDDAQVQDIRAAVALFWRQCTVLTALTFLWVLF